MTAECQTVRVPGRFRAERRFLPHCRQRREGQGGHRRLTERARSEARRPPAGRRIPLAHGHVSDSFTHAYKVFPWRETDSRSARLGGCTSDPAIAPRHAIRRPDPHRFAGDDPRADVVPGKTSSRRHTPVPPVFCRPRSGIRNSLERRFRSRSPASKPGLYDAIVAIARPLWHRSCVGAFYT